MSTSEREMRRTPQMRDVSLRELRDRLLDEKQRKHDMVVPGSSIHMKDDGTFTVLDAPIGEPGSNVRGLLEGTGVDLSDDSRADLPFEGMRTAHRQVADRLSIPWRYYKRMWNEPTGPLLARNVNEWLDRRGGNYLVRTFRPHNPAERGIFRALMSDRYMLMDNVELFFTTLKTIRDAGYEVKNSGCSLTERKMYVKFSAPSVQIDAPELLRGYRNPGTGEGGVTITAGFIISNSETGQGSFTVKPRPVVNCCTNALTWKADELRRVHLGSQLDQGAIDWSQQTRERTMSLIQSKVKDAVSTFITEDYLNDLVDRMLERDRTLEHPANAVRNCADDLGMNESEQDDLLNYFTASGQATVNGLAQSVTFHAQNVDDADRQYDYEEGVQTVFERAGRYDQPDTN
jgi:hypothetical protein